jgi:spore germination protein YaaH
MKKFIVFLFLIQSYLFSQSLVLSPHKKNSTWAYMLSKNLPNFSEKYLDSIRNKYDIICIDGIQITGKGKVRYQNPWLDKLKQTKLLSKETGSKIYPMLIFSTNRDGIEFLNSEKSQGKFRIEILQFLQENSLSGIHFDIEALPIEYSEKLSKFLKNLRSELNAKKIKLTIAVFPQIDFPENLSKLHDLNLLKDSVDEIVLMSYDLHNTKTVAGCVTSYEWTKQNLNHLLKFFKPEQIWLGIPAYGYEWNINQKKVNIVSSYDGKQYIKTNDYIREESGCLKIVKKNKSMIFFPDSETQSTLGKISDELNLKGTALWRIGLEERE